MSQPTRDGAGAEASSGLVRPQPLGILPLPAGWIVLTHDEVATDQGQLALDRLLDGRWPQVWPQSLEPLRLAAEGKVAEAADLIDPTSGGAAAYNHYLLTGEAQSLATARSVAEPGSALAALVEVAAYCLGDAEQPPDPGALDAEIRAHALSAVAADHLERGHPLDALSALESAVAAARAVSPVITALLIGQQAALRQELSGADDVVVSLYAEGVQALKGREVVETAMAEMALGMADAYQEMAISRGEEGSGLLLEAVRAYHRALRVLHPDSQPERYAFAHSNLALAYLTLPMPQDRDTVRRGVVVHSLREALRFYTPEEHRHEWAAVTLNLANALQHLPASHPVQNMLEAVRMYESLLDSGVAEPDPATRALVLLNHGSALLALDEPDRAVASLLEARNLYEEIGDAAGKARADAALSTVLQTSSTTRAEENGGPRQADTERP